MLSTQCCQTIFQSDGKCHFTPLRASGWPVYLSYTLSSTLYCLVCLFSATLVDVQTCLLGISHCTLLLIFLGKLCNFFGDVPVQIFGSFGCMEILNYSGYKPLSSFQICKYLLPLRLAFSFLMVA